MNSNIILRSGPVFSVLLLSLLSAYGIDLPSMEHFRRRAEMPLLSNSFTAEEGEIASRAVNGDVTVVNIPWKFKDGKIDWLFDPTLATGVYNPEWTWQLNRMSFWSAMAKAYHATGDEKYAKAFRDQMRRWVDTARPIGSGNERGSAWRTIETGLRLMNSWPLAFERFRKSPSLSDEDLRVMLESMHEQALHLMKYQTAKNWLLMEMNGVYTFASYFPEFADSESMRRSSSAVLARELAAQLLPDGWQNELSPDYHIVAWECFSRTYRLDRHYGRKGELPSEYPALLEKCAEVYLGMATPAFTMPRFNDCYTMHTETLLKSAAELFPQRADFQWAATHGGEGKAPEGESASRLFPYAGYAAMRTDWSADATFLAFDFGPLGCAHYHQDKLNFTLWKGGEELVFDDGGGQYEDSKFRTFGLSAHDHNTLLVDGRGQSRNWPLKSLRPIDCGWTTTGEKDEIFGEYDQEYEGGAKPVRHRRGIVFDKKADAITVEDSIVCLDGAKHEYALLFQLDTTDVVVAADRKSLRARYGKGRKWALEMSFDGVDAVELVSGQTRPTIAGWFIGRNDLVNHVATTVRVIAGDRKNHAFRTVLKPVPAADGAAGGGRK